jgi:hypothetical protein
MSRRKVNGPSAFRLPAAPGRGSGPMMRPRSSRSRRHDQLEQHLADAAFSSATDRSRSPPAHDRLDLAYYGAPRCDLRRRVACPSLRAYAGRLHHLPAAPQRSGSITSSILWDDYAMIDRRIVPIGPEVAATSDPRTHCMVGRASVLGSRRLTERSPRSASVAGRSEGLPMLRFGSVPEGAAVSAPRVYSAPLPGALLAMLGIAASSRWR